MWWANFVGYVSAKNWINWMTSDSYDKYKKGDVFFETQCSALYSLA